MHKSSYNYPIYNVSWKKKFIALGSENGKVNLLKVSNEALENSEGTIVPDEEIMCEMQSLNVQSINLKNFIKKYNFNLYYN